MSLLENWRQEAYEKEDEKERDEFWQNYFEIEQGIYNELLDEPQTIISGTPLELAKRFETDVMHFIGFLDGINTSLKESIDLENVKEDTSLEFSIDIEKLYYNMLEAKADWLYNLPQWESLLTGEQRKEIKKTQRLSGTVIKGEKIGRNDPCPCGSGKKYKKCCGINQ